MSHLDPIYARAYRIARYLHELGEIAAFKDPKLKEIQEFCERLHDSILLDRDKPEQAAELIYSEDLTTMIDLARAVIKDLSESSSGFVLRAHFLKKIAKENLQKLGREPLLNEEKFSDLDYLLLALESYENAGKSDLCSEPDPYRYNQLLDELSAFDQQLTRESIKRLLDAGYLSKDFTDFLDVWLSERSGAVIVAEAPTPKKDLAPEVLQDARSNFVGMDRLLDLGINENTARRLSKTCTQEEYDRRRLSLADCWKGRDFADRSIRDNPNILTVSPTEFNTFIALLRKALALTSDLSETDALSPVSYPVRYSGKESVQKVLASLTVRQEFNALIAEIDKADLKLDGRTAMAILRYGFVYRGKYMIGGQRMDAELVHLRQNLERHVNGIDAQRDLIAKTVKKLISFGAIDDSKGFSLGTAAVIPVLRKAVNWIVKVNDPAAGEFEFGAL